MQELTQELLKSLFTYDPDSGTFTWMVKPSPRLHCGIMAGCIDGQGYRVITINKNPYQAHRLAFLYMTGSFPLAEVDHINHIRDDNRWCNIRSATSQDNARNKSLSKTNSSGVTGVYWHKINKKWWASIFITGKKVYLGTYTELKDAIIARKNAEKKYGFHKNHGGK